ncbi:hypothetical protein HCN44_011456 [Aphidius gifuensis]|uniref:procollagen-proline 3-dioxygenase n=2 Tax=Aphidius gifuensis TaxID=684658 RepID=A0A835CSD0_APHGI|nr:hypothetical protein HCN44_011456 [Aphidius gifuensis]
MLEDKKIDRDFSYYDDMILSDIYTQSVDAYLDDNWQKCIDGFEQVIKRYKKYRNAVIQCRKKCKKNVDKFTPIFIDNIDDFHFYEKKVRETLCLLKCNQDYRDIAGLNSLKRLPYEIEKKIMEFVPYEHLHICYYQKNQFQDAANAIFTYLTIHPKHEMSISNLRYYLTLPEVEEAKVKNLEIQKFVKYYMEGVKAYEDELYELAIENFEKSLIIYMDSENDCRIYCEGPFDQGWHPEFTSSVANHFAYCLKCKRSCSLWLNNINGDYQKDLLSSHYNYLQFAYYKLGDIKNTCQAVESYLLFYPADETMINNKMFYSKLPKVQKNLNFFRPREEAVYYVKRQEYELRLLKYISDEFSLIDAKLSTSKNKSDKKSINNEKKAVNHPPPGHSPSSRLVAATDKFLEKKKISRRQFEIEKRLNKTKIIARENELGGKSRYLAEGFLIDSECDSLVQLAKIAAVKGDGYEDNKSPHSKNELFEGLTLGRAALMVYFGLLEPKKLQLFLHSTETARGHVKKFFNLDQELFFTYTHLVCRSALTDLSERDEDVYSHDIHADNCLAIDDNTCLHESPAYTWRDYSAIIYLNDDFDGGEFVFSADPKAQNIQSIIKPKCGRMIGFTADEKNLHGVKGVVKGKRCALAIWFTLNEKYYETERKLAEIILERVMLKGPFKPIKNFKIPLNYEKLLFSRFKEDEILKLLINLS